MPRLPALLADDARDKWDAISRAADQMGLDLQIPPELDDESRTVLACSDFVARAGQHAPEVFDDLLHNGDLERVYPSGTFRKRVQACLPTSTEDLDRVEQQLSTGLRKLRQREMVRIAWRDIAGRAELEETMTELSNLADNCIDGALGALYDCLCRQLGTPTGRGGAPQQLVVLGMGKLGARELNFSSDVDLILAFPEGGRTVGAPSAISNDEFFTRLGRRLVRVLGQVTAEGFVFRIDTNLRPFGESGPLAMSFAALEGYYQNQGREWERYAWIKARVVAGDREAGRNLMTLLQPFIYRRYLDYGVFESLREMKQKIAMEVKRRGIEKNIKLGAGGIREVEFFGQMFQLIRGGVEPDLQERRILRVLALLVDYGSVAPETGAALRDAYRFLRRVEHRLQAYRDQQTHDLPEDPTHRLRLAWAMGYSDPTSFLTALADHRRLVHNQFATLLEPVAEANAKSADNAPIDPLSTVWHASLDPDQAHAILAGAGFADPPDMMRRLTFLHRQADKHKFSAEGRQRLDRLMPLFLGETSRADQPDLTLGRIIDILANIGRRTTYLALLAENPPVLQHLVRLVGASHFIAAFLARHPVLLDELIDPRTLFRPPERAEMERDLAHTLGNVPSDEMEFLIESLCIFQQVKTLRVAAADVSGVLPLMKVSDHLSDLAEVVLDAVVTMVWRDLVAKHGEPTCQLGTTSGCNGFVIVAYGKLGGFELGYGSDLDLVFLHAAARGQTRGGRHPIDNAQFFSRLGQRVIHVLTTHTRAGRIYETDMRLRPSGSSGPLVSHIEAFETYQRESAWTWEHQALIRSRAICGDPALRERYQQIREAVLVQPRDLQQLKHDVRDMRRRLMEENTLPGDSIFDLKQGRGGIVDIEFLVQFLVLACSHAHPNLTRWTDNVRLLVTLIDSGLMDHTTAYRLREAYLTYRAAVHRLSLQDHPPELPMARFRSQRDYVISAWQHFLEENGPPTVPA
jgi:[glutamine synthetase] adenylyltransferase / [glutamine synthetase]-adenylyl-L-tyrosine phosphorylase